MPYLSGTEQGVTVARPGRLRPTLVAVACFLRGLPLLLCATPKTPLRVLCLIALDTVHVLRTGRPLPRSSRNLSLSAATHQRALAFHCLDPGRSSSAKRALESY